MARISFTFHDIRQSRGEHSLKGQGSRKVEIGLVSEIDGTLICENLKYLMKKNANFSHLTLKLSIFTDF